MTKVFKKPNLTIQPDSPICFFGNILLENPQYLKYNVTDSWKLISSIAVIDEIIFLFVYYI